MASEATAAMLAAVEEVAESQRECLDSLRKMSGSFDQADSALSRISASLNDTSASLCRIQKMQAEMKEILIAYLDKQPSG